MKYKLFLLLCGLSLSFGCVALSKPVFASLNMQVNKTLNDQPNILLIMLDDAGYSDIGAFAKGESNNDDSEDTPKSSTPNLDQLAKEGVRFSRFYADATCRPARISLLTGRQASRVVTSPDSAGISPEVEMLPEKLQAAGYSTHHVGKWHLGDHTRLAWPSAQGFDHWFGFLNQFVLRRGFSDEKNIHYRRPTYRSPWLQRDDGLPKQYEGHVEDILTAEVITKIEKSKNNKQPWFINYWTLTPHNPVQPAERYRVRYPLGKEGQYQALMAQMDDNIGKILSTLEKTGQAENTLVLVLSDNGGTNQFMPNNASYSGVKGIYSEGATRTPMIMRWPKHIKANTRYDGVTAIYDIYPTLLSLLEPDEGIEKIDGVNLWPLMNSNKPRPSQTLFWEMATIYTYQYSVLSEDGRWRLDDGQLYDLQTDPQATMDLAKQQKNIYNNLYQQFLQWRRYSHQVKLKIENFSANKNIFKITGDSFRRSPGYGGFTFVTSITPQNERVPSGMIVEQKGMWSMILDKEQRLQIQTPNELFVSEPLKLNTCTPLVVSSYYSRSKLLPKQNSGVWFVMAGDKQVLLENRVRPALFPDNFLEPTYVGQGSKGKQVFNGVLEEPKFYNEFYYPNDPWKVERDPYWLTENLCQN